MKNVQIYTWNHQFTGFPSTDPNLKTPNYFPDWLYRQIPDPTQKIRIGDDGIVGHNRAFSTDVFIFRKFNLLSHFIFWFTGHFLVLSLLIVQFTHSNTPYIYPRKSRILFTQILTSWLDEHWICDTVFLILGHSWTIQYRYSRSFIS